jgi:hypothetical protein
MRAEIVTKKEKGVWPERHSQCFSAAIPGPNFPRHCLSFVAIVYAVVTVWLAPACWRIVVLEMVSTVSVSIVLVIT